MSAFQTTTRTEVVVCSSATKCLLVQLIALFLSISESRSFSVPFLRHEPLLKRVIEFARRLPSTMTLSKAETHFSASLYSLFVIRKTPIRQKGANSGSILAFKCVVFPVVNTFRILMSEKHVWSWVTESSWPTVVLGWFRTPPYMACSNG